MKILDRETYLDKVHGCFSGKNIGGVLGAPFEGLRQLNDVDFYVQDLKNGPPPNDDLDLQIVWLAAAERYGRQVDAKILGEYWLSYVIPNWVEYGTGKANLRAGLNPPMSGLVENTYKDSNGCFIRSEIWACLAPGHPEIASWYAHEDGIVDHEGEGMYGEVFFAALQSAAFVESDKRKLVEIGLSYIPADSALAKCVRKAVECCDQGVDFTETRRIIHNMAPGTFGIQETDIDKIKEEGNEGLEIGEPGYDCPENVGFTIAAWFYGEDDFGKSILLANYCGEDTDCTAATLAATMGIILGESGIPDKWKAPLDDRIMTMCIDQTLSGVWVPDNAEDLAKRIAQVMPQFLGTKYCDILAEGWKIRCLEDEALFFDRGDNKLPLINGNHKDEMPTVRVLWNYDPYTVHFEFPAFHVLVDLEGSVHFRADEPRKIRVTVINSITMREQQWAKITAYLPEGVTAIGGNSVEKPLNNLYRYRAEHEFTLNTEAFTGSRLEMVIDVSLVGRHSSGPVKVVLFRE